MSAIDPASWRRVLVVKMFAMGDVLNATPVFRALRRALPGCRIDLVVGQWSAAAVAGNPNIDEAVVFDDAELRSQGIGGIWRFVRRLRSRRYDAAVILHRAVRVNAMIAACGVPVRAGIGWKGRGPFLTRQAYEGPETSGHEIRRYLNVLSVLGIPDAGGGDGVLRPGRGFSLGGTDPGGKWRRAPGRPLSRGRVEPGRGDADAALARLALRGAGAASFS